MSEEKSEPKIGAGHASAMFRQGLAELRAAVYPESNVAQPGQYGLYGTLTPGEVADGRKSTDRDLDEEPRSTVGQRLEQVEQDPRGQEPEPPQHERE